MKAARLPRPDAGESRVERLALRLHLTEGQLYTVVVAVIGVLLLLSSGLPGSGETPPSAPPGAATTGAP